MKVDNLIPFNLNCALCGAKCEAKIPIVGKTISFNMPPCPIKAGPYKKSIVEALPSKSPIPVKTGAKGTVTAKGADGSTLFEMSLTASVGPGGDLEWRVFEEPDMAVAFCGCKGDCAGALCPQVAQASKDCSKGAAHGITAGEACSKVCDALNAQAHGLVTFSGCTGTFNPNGQALKEMVVSKAFLADSAAPVKVTHYGDPSSKAGCEKDELPIKINGLGGQFCSPGCQTNPWVGTKNCPTDVPPGSDATPQCALESPGSQYATHCALFCDQGITTCPKGATCKLVKGSLGMWTYDN